MILAKTKHSKRKIFYQKSYNMQTSFFLFDTKSKSSKSACKHELKKALITGKDESNGSYYIKIINFNNISGDIGTEHNSK